MKKKINIIFFGRFDYPHGMASTKRVQHFVDYFAERECQPKVLVYRPDNFSSADNIFFGFHKANRYKIIGSKIRKNFLFPFYFILSYPFLFSTLVQWQNRKLRNVFYVYDNIDIENLFFVLFAKILGYKIVVDIVEDYSLTNEKLGFKKKLKIKTISLLEKKLPYLADGIITISSYLQNKFESILKNKEKVVLIPISAEVKDNRTRLKNDLIRYVYSGTYGKKDAIDLLLKGFAAFAKKHDNVELVLLGKTKNTVLMEQIKQIKQVRYLGYLPDEEFYTALLNADVLCMTRTGSLYANAGFPFKLGEYLATGNAVIASDVSDVSKFLEDQVDALLIEPESEVALIEAMEYFYNNPDKRLEIGQNGKNKCRQYFNPKINSEVLYNFIRQI